MSERRTSRRVSTVPIRKPAAEEFVAAEMFDFSKGFKSPKGVMTRARRSSVKLDKPPLPARSNRRKSMMPTVEENTEKPVTNRRKSMLPQTKTKPVSGIELKNFYQSPKTSGAGGRKPVRSEAAVTGKKTAVSRNLELAVSPKKKIAPSSGISMSDADILKSLDEIVVDDVAVSPPEVSRPAAKTPAKSKAKSQTAGKKTPAVKTPPASARRATRQTPAVKSQKKTPKKRTPKTAKKSAKKATSKSTKEDSFSQVMKEVRDVEVKLRNLDDGEEAVDPNIILTKLESLPATPERVDMIVESLMKERTSRKRKSEESESEAEVTPTKKRRIQATPAAKSTKKATGAVKSVKKTPAAAAKSPEAKMTPAVKSPKAAPTPKSVKKTPAPKSVKKGVKSSVKLVSAPAGGGIKKTPGLRRVLGRAAAGPTVSTPVQVNPAKMLKRNLRTKVETALENKMAQKPDSSPYLLTNPDENSPKFEKIAKSTETEEIKAHITGTPAVTRRTRKFGTAIQPSMLAAESPVPMSTRRMVSTPLRGKVASEPVADSTPIRAPKSADSPPSSPPMSPPGEMVTGKLGKLCVVM